MRPVVLFLCFVLTPATTWGSQPQQPPQSPRQALLEMFFGAGPDHLEKHLPELAKKAFRQLDSGGSKNFLTEISAFAEQARAPGGNFQILETGPVLLVAEGLEAREKFEVVVESDNLLGEEDQIDLSFHFYRNGREETLPVLPRLTLSMKMEAKIWRLNEINLSARVPLGDPEFMKGLIGNLLDKQQRSNEVLAIWSVRSIIAAETAYHSHSPAHAYTCSLAELGRASKENDEGSSAMMVDDELAAGKKSGYIFALTGCDALHYKVAAEPASSSAGQRAFCADESGEVKFAKNGKATTCLSQGESLSSESPASVGVGRQD